jgi:hypothetical protein
MFDPGANSNHIHSLGTCSRDTESEVWGMGELAMVARNP